MSLEQEKINIALIGNPNTGKTSVFNLLSGLRQKVSNYSGTTVEKRIAQLELYRREDQRAPIKGGIAKKTLAATKANVVKKIQIIDLPGLYSLNTNSKDALITREILENSSNRAKKTKKNSTVLEKVDFLLFVMDSTNIIRNMFLYSQISELEIPTCVILTMTDLLEEKPPLDTKLFSKILGVPVTSLSPNKHRDMGPFKEKLLNFLESPKRPKLIAPKNSAKETQKKEELRNPAATSWERYEIIRKTLRFLKFPQQRENKLQKRLYSFLDNPITGFSSFIGVMYLMFQAIYSWAAPIMEMIDSSLNLLAAQFSALELSLPVFHSLVTHGIIGGVGAVVIFVPQIFLLFFFITFLEDIGYLARASAIVDKLLSWSGLNGRAFIPIMASYACAIPGIMATRSIRDERTRVATILTLPLVSCSARLPIYLLFIGSFIEPYYGVAIATLTFFFMHIIGILIALPLAYVFNRNIFILKEKSSLFFLEVPPLRMPIFSNIFHRANTAVKKFIYQAGTLIFAFSILIWTFSYFPNTTEKLSPQERLEKSYLGQAGKSISPIFKPLGFDWKITVGILSAFPAREIIISTLSILYTGEEESSKPLGVRMQEEKKEDKSPVFTPLVALSLMLFFSLCGQCLSTLSLIYQELKSIKWPIFVFSYMTLIAYLSSLSLYQIGLLLGFR